MDNIDQALAAASKKLRAILSKKKRGQKLSAPEQTFLDAAVGSTRAPRVGEAPSPNLPDKAAGMDHAVAILQPQFPQLNKSLLRQLKKTPEFKECFDGANRVRVRALIAPLTKYFATAPAATAKPTKLDLECERLAQGIRKVRAEANAIEEVSIERAAVITSNRSVSSELKKLLRKLETEMPGEVTGKDLAQNRKYGAALYDELCVKISAWESEWPE